MSYFSDLTIKSKLLIWLLLASLCSIGAIGFLGWRSGQVALKESIVRQLISQRATKAEQVKNYIEIVYKQTQTLSEDLMIVDAMREFRAAFIEFSGQEIPKEWDDGLAAFYQNDFLPRLKEYGDPTASAWTFQPKSKAARYLQHHYITANPFPTEEKDMLLDAMDGSSYSSAHAKFHPILDRFRKQFGYHDMLLVDFNSEVIVYSVYKEVDFGTSLISGPYRDSNLARVVEAVKRDPDLSTAKVVDFEPYIPTHYSPEAFIASPIFDGTRPIGILVLEFPVDKMNEMMSWNYEWEKSGLGRTGETILVGSDHLMRSESRFFREDSKDYLEQLRAAGYTERTVEGIDHFGTPIMYQVVRTPPVEAALSGRTGTMVADDYRGVPVLSAYAPLDVEGLHWAVLAEVEVDEVFAPVRNLQRNVLIATIIMVLFVTVLSIALARILVRPIRSLTGAVRAAAAGEAVDYEEIDFRGEVGELSTALRGLLGRMGEQSERMTQVEAENDTLRLSILPPPIAKRMKQGEQEISEFYKQMTVLYVEVGGIEALSSSHTVPQVAKLVSQLVNAVDGAAKRRGVERVESLGGAHLYVCGLSEARLDHAKRGIDFALEAVRLTQRLATDQQSRLGLRIGVAAGEVSGGLIGESKIDFELWGGTVAAACALQRAAKINAILVTTAMRAQLGEMYECSQIEPARTAEGGEIEAWALRTEEAPAPLPAGAS